MSGYRFEPSPVVPVTEPAASRFLPPTYPPAPPGAAGAGDSEDPRAVATSLADLLQLVFAPIISIRESLLTLESVPLDAPLAPTQRDSICLMQELASAELDSIRDRIEARSPRFLSTDLDLVKRELLRMAARGMERDTLDLFAKIVHASELEVFQEVARTDAMAENHLPDRSYRFPLPAYFSAGQLGLMPPPQAVRALLGDLRRVLSHDDSTVSRHTFDKQVTQRLIAIEFAAWVATPQPQAAPSPMRFTPTVPELDPEERRIQEWRRSSGEP